MRHEAWELKQMQSLPLDAKVNMTKQRLRQWVESWNRYEIVNAKTGRVRYVTDTKEPTKCGSYVERNGVLRLRHWTKLKPDEYVESVQRGMAYISRSGGKDSDVLGDIAREEFPDLPHVFINTGLEYTSVRKHGEAASDVTIRPQMPFNEILKTYGYPIISKEVAQCIEGLQSLADRGICDSKLGLYRTQKLNGELRTKDGALSKYNIPKWKFLLNAPFRISQKCCDFSKKAPAKKYTKESGNMPVIATMACESRLRLKNWFANGCNAFETESPVSQPIAFWTEQDVLEYIVTRNLKIADVYGTVVNRGGKLVTSGKKRTGCVFCLFGIMYEKDRLAKLQKEEPAIADYVLRGGEFGDDGYWEPSREGLGYWFVIDWLNLHGLGVLYENAEKYRNAYGNAKTEELLSGKSD